MKISKEAKIGFAALVAIAMFIWGFNFLKGKNIFSYTDTFYMQYDELGGLKETDAVLINGFKVGHVNGLKLVGNGKHSVQVEILVEEKHKIPLGSEARLSSIDFLGTMAIELILTDTKVFHNDGDTLKASVKKGMLEDVDILTEKVMSIATGIDSMVISLVEILDDEFKVDIKDAAQGLSSTTHDLSKLLADDGELQRVLFHLGEITEQLNVSMASLPETMDNINVLTDSLRASEIKSLIANTSSTLHSLSTVMAKIENGEGTTGKLVNSDSLYVGLTKTTKELELLLNDLRNNPKRYVHFSLFGKGDK